MVLKSNSPSIDYHNIFDFKLTKEESVKWQYKNQKIKVSGIKNKSRLQREKYSQAKLILATKAAKVISKIPTVKFVGITGALAMMNCGKDGDIDLMVITKNGHLWTTRLVSYLVIWLSGYKTRSPKNKLEKDRLCMNLWMDESDLVWGKENRNIYTAHEIAQVVPLVNRDNAYERFLQLNDWILEYWPNSVKINNHKLISKKIKSKTGFLEKMFYSIQYWYMKNKITREVITPTRAIFHPKDWSKVVLSKLLPTNS